MIVKMVDDVGNQYIYSDITDVTVGITTKEELDKDGYNKFWITKSERKLDLKYYYRIFRLFKDDTLTGEVRLEKRIVVDSWIKVYLMNDEGKTIERLN